MGCLSAVFLGNNLTFSITTHNPDTGALTDADSAPAYRVYEELTSPPILTGTMTLFDGANTTGFYMAQIACTEANGFEDGKSYNIYIEAPVNSDTGGISFAFRAQTPVWSEAVRTLTRSAAGGELPSGSDIEILRGDTWSVPIEGLGDISDRDKLWFTVKKSRSDEDSESSIQIEEAAGLLYLNSEDASARAANGSITVTDAVVGNITIGLDKIETAELLHNAGLPYDVQMLDSSGDVTTLAIAAGTVTDDVTRAIA